MASTAIPVKKHKSKVRAVLAQIAANQPGLTVIDFTGSVSFQMKPAVQMENLAAALQNNSVVTELKLVDCGLIDSCAPHIARIIAETQTISNLDISGNKLKDSGVSHLTPVLAENSSIKYLNLLGMEFGETSLSYWLEMLNRNITLLNINWVLTSRKSFALNKALTRNKEIFRLKKAGRDYNAKLPPAIRDGEKLEPIVVNAKVKEPKKPVAETIEKVERNRLSMVLTNRKNIYKEATKGNKDGNWFEGKKVTLLSRNAKFIRVQFEDGSEKWADPRHVEGDISGVKMVKRKSVNKKKKTKRKKKLMPRKIIELIGNNDPEYVDVNFDNNVSFSMKVEEYCTLLGEALSRNTIVKSVSCKKCKVTDQAVQKLCEAFATSTTIESIDFEGNGSIGSRSLTALANALKSNESIERINLTKVGTLGESSITDFCEMFSFNITLKELRWRVHSRTSTRITSFLTRNTEIARLREAGKPYEHLYPSAIVDRLASRPAPEEIIPSPPIAEAPTAETESKPVAEVKAEAKPVAETPKEEVATTSETIEVKTEEVGEISETVQNTEVQKEEATEKTAAAAGDEFFDGEYNEVTTTTQSYLSGNDSHM